MYQYINEKQAGNGGAVHPIRRATAWSRSAYPEAATAAECSGSPSSTRIGSGLWASVSVLYFTYVSGLSLAEVGTLARSPRVPSASPAHRSAASLADRLPAHPRPARPSSSCAPLASCALLTTDNYALLLVFSAVGSLGDRAASVLTKLYATRVAGPDRVRYQAVQPNRRPTPAGRSAASPPPPHSALGTTAAYQWLLVGDALSFVASALLTLRCGEPPSSSRTVTTSKHPAPTTSAGQPLARPHLSRLRRHRNGPLPRRRGVQGRPAPVDRSREQRTATAWHRS